MLCLFRSRPVNLSAAVQPCLQLLQAFLALCQQCSGRPVAGPLEQTLLLLPLQRFFAFKLRVPLGQVFVQSCNLLLQRLHGSALVIQKLDTNLQPSSDFLSLLILLQHFTVGMLGFIRCQLRK
ncbi:hypothetical protein D3C87_1776570 [compost metagenome]